MRFFGKTTLFLFGSFLLIATSFFIFLWLYVHIKGAPNLSVSQTTIYYDNQGEIIGESSNGKRRTWVALDEVSSYFKDAIITIEDRKFYSHYGIDLKRILAASLMNIKTFNKTQGASTISQQYARTLFLNHEKSWQRKYKELLYAFRIETYYSKDEILEGYINTIYFGHGMYGIQEASNYYFGKKAKDLTLAQAALLAGLPKGPNIYSPFISIDKAKFRQKIILKAMLEAEKISLEQYNQSIVEANNYQYNENNLALLNNIAPYFQDEMKKELEIIFQDQLDVLAIGGIKVFTTLDSKQQLELETIVNETLQSFEELQTAAIIMEPDTGKVLSIVGGRDYNKSQFNRGTQGKRQIGSTIKPLLYYSALNNGFTAATMLKSEATSFQYDDDRQEYEPHNFNHLYANRDITMMQALAVSDNIYAVKTHFAIGFNELTTTTKEFGIKSPVENIPSAALGSSVMRPIEIINAYNYFANGGKFVEPNYITKVQSADGTILYERKYVSTQVLNQENTFILAKMLENMFDEKFSNYATVTGASIKDQLTRTYAGKTGSTLYDSWMIGFDANVNVGVWVGYDIDKKLENIWELQSAKIIWAKAIENSKTTDAKKAATMPENVKKVKVDLDSGMLAGKDCPNVVAGYFVSGSEPKLQCSLHKDEKIEKNENNENKTKSWLDKLLEKIF